MDLKKIKNSTTKFSPINYFYSIPPHPPSQNYKHKLRSFSLTACQLQDHCPPCIFSFPLLFLTPLHMLPLKFTLTQTNFSLKTSFLLLILSMMAGLLVFQKKNTFLMRFRASYNWKKNSVFHSTTTLSVLFSIL